MKDSRFVRTCVALSVFLCAAPQASALILDATERGSYTGNDGLFGTGGAGTAQGNYLTGTIRSIEYRSFFNFDLSSITGTVSAATLSLSLTDNAQGDLTETLGIFDVTTDIPSLISESGGLAAFSDLGSGTQFGSATAPASATSGSATILFNAQGVSAINSAIGADFAVGGALTSLSGATGEYLFGNSIGASRLTQLDLTLGPASPVPAPATLTLFGLGFAGLGYSRRKKA